MSTKLQDVYLTKSPYCNHILDPSTAVDGWVTCECGHRSHLNWVSELGWLQARTAWVEQRIRGSEPWFDSRTSSGPATAEQSEPPKQRVNAGQQVLYILGGLSLIVAVVVFAAVAWERIGALGQALTLLIVTAVASAIAIKARDSLVGLSNTAAVVATGVAATGLMSAPLLGLFPEWWSEPSSFYPITVTLLVGGLSFIAGVKTKITGWVIMASPTVFISTLLFSQEIIRVNVGENWVIAATVLTVSIAVIAFDYLNQNLFARIPNNTVLPIANTVLAFYLSFIALTTSFGMMGNEGAGFITAVAYIFAAAIWIVVTLHWNTKESVIVRKPIITRFAKQYVAIFMGLAVAQSLTSEAQLVGLNNMWRIFLIGSLIGAVAILLPVVMVQKFELVRTETTIAASTLWFLTFGIGNGVLLQNDEDRLPILMTFFIIIAAALAVRWIFDKHDIYFFGALIAGAGAVASFSVYYILEAFDEPEAVTIPLALWLLLALSVLQKRTDHALPSFLTWGLPLCVAIIPSAAVAVALVDVSEVSSTSAWVRFWIVLALSIGLTVAGARLRVTGLLVPGAISFALVAFPQIWVQLSLIIPRWVFFALLGALLITIAARFEYVQKLSKASSSWFEKLK